MILYITFNDPPSGIYFSQVTDVIKFLRHQLQKKVRLIAFISLRGFITNRRKIINELPDALVIPMCPGIKRWRLNVYSLKAIVFFFNPTLMAGRSIISTKLALLCKRNKTIVIYDGRGAIAAEWHEYGVVSDPEMQKESVTLEREVINVSDRQIAVSKQLLEYWKTNFGYNKSNAVVIPCTLNAIFEKLVITLDHIQKCRFLLGYLPDDIVFVYSGSTAGWQGFSALSSVIEPILKASTKNKLLFMSPEDNHILYLLNKFPEQVKRKHVTPSMVPNILISGDFGLLIREYSITNKVASPVKYSEYLASGLKVIISKDLGDYTQFTLENDAGHVFSPGIQLKLQPVPIHEKLRLQKLALDNFTKKSHFTSYATLYDESYLSG